MAQGMLRCIPILALNACIVSLAVAVARTTRSSELQRQNDASTISLVQHSVERAPKNNPILPDAPMLNLEDQGAAVVAMARDTTVDGKVQPLDLNNGITDITQLRQHTVGTRVIVAVYVILYMPVCIGWLLVIRWGWTERSQAVMLPLTLCALVVGIDVINQALSSSMNSPMGLTVVQAFALFAFTGILWGGKEVAAPAFSSSWWWPLSKWLISSVGFAVFQLVNHMVSYWCSLSERTVFTNLAPVASLIFETTMMPKEVRISFGIHRKAALANMVLGAILFSVQYPDFTGKGIAAAILLVVVMIPYRLAQRWFLHDCACLPISLVASLDGLIATIPSVSVMGVQDKGNFWPMWGNWFEKPDVCLLIVLSCIAFAACHICGLTILRLGSATNCLVMVNLANICVICTGIFLFKDSVAGRPLEIIGIALSLFGGLWYAYDVAQSMPTTKDGKGKLADNLAKGKEIQRRQSEPHIATKSAADCH